MEFQNTYALAMKEEFALTNKIQTISDVSKMNQLKAGFTLEFVDREDGYRGIQELYKLSFDVKSLEPTLRYEAIDNGDVEIVDAYSTDSQLKEYGLVVLEDDKELFPPYQCASLLKESTLETYPELEGILNKLSGLITSEEMSEMNYKVNVEEELPSEVAHAFLLENNLID